MRSASITWKPPRLAVLFSMCSCVSACAGPKDSNGAASSSSASNRPNGETYQVAFSYFLEEVNADRTKKPYVTWVKIRGREATFEVTDPVSHSTEIQTTLGPEKGDSIVELLKAKQIPVEVER
jgi:hypothetical protein